MKHVAPTQWAQLCRGQATPAQQQAWLAHASRCPRCAASRQTIEAATASFAELATATPPELPYEAIRTQTMWKVAADARSTSQRMAAVRPRRIRWAALAGFSAILAAGAWWMVPRVHDEATAPRQAAVARATAHGPHREGGMIGTASPRTTAPDATAGRVADRDPAGAAQPVLASIYKIAGGPIALDGVHLDPRSGGAVFDAPIRVGAVLATGAGAATLQLESQAAVTIAPASTVTLHALNAREIAFAVSGSVDVAVAERLPGQRFTVLAGTRAITVHGTQFVVAHEAGTTTVTCVRGLVELQEGPQRALVQAGQVLRVTTAGAWGAPRALTEPERATLTARMAVVEAARTATGDARLRIQGKANAVRVDGIDLGAAPIVVRVAPGRHRVETETHAGMFATQGWVRVAAHTASEFVLPTQDGVGRTRIRHLHARLDPKAVQTCMRPLAKQGLGMGYVLVQISVNAQGDVVAANLVDGDVSGSIAECVRAHVATLQLPEGPAVQFVVRIPQTAN